MTRDRTRDEAIQDYLDGRIGGDELHRLLGLPPDPDRAGPDGPGAGGGDAGLDPSVREELSVYRAVWRMLEMEPDRFLAPDFARRTARAAAAERPSGAGDRWIAGLVAGSSLAGAAAALAAMAMLLSSAGFPLGEIARQTGAFLGGAPSGLWGVAGVGGVLYAFDRLLSGRSGLRGSGG